ncbi:MAG TPA: hypothetical protein VH062_17160 [Polyangiaceae bacterium]|jgi:hypothetical protein|nr:hypothetical protein [Polyangiaceae bacterium]
MQRVPPWMTLPLALRSRIKLHDEPERARARALPAFALPVASYWAIMGLLTYGVASGVLRPERLASLRIFPRESFESERVTPPADDARPTAPRAPPVRTPPATTEPPAEVAPPQLAAVASSPEPPPDDEPSRAARSTVRPLSGFSLGAPYEDDDGDRYTYSAVARRDREDARDQAEKNEEVAALPSRREEPAPRVARRDPLLDREWKMPEASEFAPASRGGIAVHQRDVSSKAGHAARTPFDPYPGAPDDDAPSSAPRPAARNPSPARDDPEPAHARPPAAAASVTSCEAAVANANEEMDLTKAQGSTPDVTRGAYAAVLERGGYLTPCAVPSGMTLDVCAAIRDGRTVGITVVTSPADARLRACVRNAVAAIAFPRSPRLDVTRTRFDRSGGR